MKCLVPKAKDRGRNEPRMDTNSHEFVSGACPDLGPGFRAMMEHERFNCGSVLKGRRVFEPRGDQHGVYEPVRQQRQFKKREIS